MNLHGDDCTIPIFTPPDCQKHKQLIQYSWQTRQHPNQGSSEFKCRLLLPYQAVMREHRENECTFGRDADGLAKHAITVSVLTEHHELIQSPGAQV